MESILFMHSLTVNKIKELNNFNIQYSHNSEALSAFYWRLTRFSNNRELCQMQTCELWEDDFMQVIPKNIKYYFLK